MMIAAPNEGCLRIGDHEAKLRRDAKATRCELCWMKRPKMRWLIQEPSDSLLWDLPLNRKLSRWAIHWSFSECWCWCRSRCHLGNDKLKVHAPITNEDLVTYQQSSAPFLVDRSWIDTNSHLRPKWCQDCWRPSLEVLDCWRSKPKKLTNHSEPGSEYTELTSAIAFSAIRLRSTYSSGSMPLRDDKFLSRFFKKRRKT